MKYKSSFGIILVLLGIGFLLEEFNIISFNNIISTYWPLILIVIGIKIILKRSDNNFKNSNKNLSSEDYIDEFAIMSGLETNIQSQEFKGGKITSIMASVELDLTDSKLYNNEATININTVMSGVEIYVPENWKIKHNGSPIMGEFTNKKRYKEDSDSPILNINFSIIMGSIEVK